MSIDLHCHTIFSIDSYGTPEELVDIAAARGVTALAITEHNHMGGIERGKARASAHGIRFFPGVELDAFYGERSYHFLGLGVDPANPSLRKATERNYTVYTARFEQYFQFMKAHGFPWDRRQLEAYLPMRYPSHPNPLLNYGFVKYFVEQQGGWDGFDEINEIALQGMINESGGWRDVDDYCDYTEARDAVHDAGGVFLLAHVGKIFPGDPKSQSAFIGKLLEQGIDGFELYHYANFKGCGIEHLTEFARQTGCVVTGGSDCGHAHIPTQANVGTCGAPDELAEQLAKVCRSF